MISKVAVTPLIAVVDDDASLCRSVARFLQASGFGPTTYDSAESFLADQNYSRFDCLIVDVQLHGMSGIALREQLLSAGVRTPVVLMTARDARETHDPGGEPRDAIVIRKSDPGEKLLGIIREALKPCRREEGIE